MRIVFVRLPLVIAFFTLLSLSVPSNLAVVRADGDASDPAVYSNDWRTTGPPGGDVRGLVVDPSNPDRFYFGTLDGQIYTSSDGGHQWQLLYNVGKPKLFVDHIIVDPRNPKVLYVGAHRHNQPGGFFKSTDGGVTWKESEQLKNESVHSLAQSESNPDTLIAGTFNTIFRSDDAGDTWKQLPTTNVNGLLHVESLAIDPRGTNTIYAGTWYLPYKSTDGGQTWRIIKNGIIDDSDIFAINLDPRNPNHIIASACSGIYETTDAGNNWHKVQGIPSQSRRTRAILQHPTIPGLVFAGTTEGFWRSGKGGDNNSWMVTTSRQLEINSIAVHPRNPDTVYIATNNYGVMVSHDAGRNFVPTNSGFSGRFVNTIVPDREQANRVYATTINTTTGGGFFFVSNDGGNTWQPSMRNMPPRLIAYALLQDDRNPNAIYLGTNLGIYRSLDRGASWSTLVGKKPAPPKRPARKSAGSSAARSTTARTQERSTNPGERIIVAPKVSDDVVRKAQEALDRAGYEIGTADGHLGPRTVAALKRFQSDRYLPVTGEIDEATIGALGLGSVAANALAHVLSLTEPVNALASFTDAIGESCLLAATNAGLYSTFDP